MANATMRAPAGGIRSTPASAFTRSCRYDDQLGGRSEQRLQTATAGCTVNDHHIVARNKVSSHEHHPSFYTCRVNPDCLQCANKKPMWAGQAHMGCFNDAVSRAFGSSIWCAALSLGVPQVYWF